MKWIWLGVCFPFGLVLCEMINVLLLGLFMLLNGSLLKGMKGIQERLTTYSPTQLIWLFIGLSISSALLGGYVSYHLFFQTFLFAEGWTFLLILLHMSTLVSLGYVLYKEKKK